MEMNDYFKDINPENFAKASALLEQWGFSVSEALDMFFTQLAEEQYFPYAEIPNETTLAAIEKSRRGEGLREAKDIDDLFRQLGLKNV